MEGVTYRNHVVEPTELTTRDGRKLFSVSGPLVNAFVCYANVRIRIDGRYRAFQANVL